jgi:hypothetical protein
MMNTDATAKANKGMLTHLINPTLGCAVLGLAHFQ